MKIKWTLALRVGLLATIVLICPFVRCAFGQGHTIKLTNGNFINIQVCNDQTFRIRVSPSNSFPETLMERYDIVKRDWNKETKVTKHGSDYRLATDRNRLEINGKDGTVTVRSSSDDEIITRLSVVEKGNQTYEALYGTVTDYEQSLPKKEIIGDTTRKDQVSENLKQTKKRVDPAILSLSITPNERFYGGGAASRKAIQHRGSLLRIWATYQQSDMVAPFLVSSRGWGIFNNTTALNYFDVGHF